MFIDGLCKRLIDYALIIFAGTFTFGVAHAKEGYAFWSSLALVIVMACLVILDRRYHRLSHGWRKTQRQFVSLICDAINGATGTIEFRSYLDKGESEAEWMSVQSVLFYLLSLVSAGDLIYSLLRFPTPWRM